MVVVGRFVLVLVMLVVEEGIGCVLTDDIVVVVVC